MAYIARCKHDVFVSYAHVDDEPLSGADQGWVTTLVDDVRKSVARTLESVSFWMDHALSGESQLTPPIIDALRSSASLLVVVSPAYLRSKWCHRERNAFLEQLKTQSNGTRPIFLIELDPIDRTELPNEFGDLLSVQFWTRDHEGERPRLLGSPKPDPVNHPRYYDKLLDLSYKISVELKRLGKGGPAAAEPERPAVFLAEATDDLDELREAVASYLDQSKIRVLPERYYPRDDPKAFKAQLLADMAGCKAFVQILSEFIGKRPPGMPAGYGSFQFDLARQAGIPILQWRRQDLKLESIADPAYRALVGGEWVRACGIEEFKPTVTDTAFKAAPPRPSQNPVNAMVFVNADSADRDLGKQVAQCLCDRGVMCSMPLSSGQSTEIRADFEANLLNCDGLIVVYGATTVSWVRNQFLQIRKITGQRKRPLAALAVYEGPPSAKDELAFMFPNLDNLNGRAGLNQGVLERFIDRLQVH